MWFSKWGLSDLLSRRGLFPWQRIGRKKQRRKRDQANISPALIWSWWCNTLTSAWNPRHNWYDLSVILLWSRSCPNLNPAMYPWPWHWTLTIGRENWWSPNDHIYWAPSRRSNCSTKVNKWSTDMRRSWVLGSNVTKSLEKNPGKKCYRTFSKFHIHSMN